ncbi:hypothetical protein D3C84_1020460 [compost metagenome]
MRNYNWRPRNEHQILREDLNIYPFDVFCAKEWRTRKITVTENTHTIHHFSASWHTRTQRIKNKARSILGPKIINFLTLFYKK